MKKRIIGAGIVLMVLIVSLILGDKVFGIVMTVAAVLGFKELVDIKYKNKKIDFVKIVSSLCLILLLFNNILYKVNNDILIVLPILILIIPIIFYDDRNRYNITDAFYFLGIVYFLAFAFLAPYLERLCILLATPVVSNVPRII